MFTLALLKVSKCAVSIQIQSFAGQRHVYPYPKIAMLKRFSGSRNRKKSKKECFKQESHSFHSKKPCKDLTICSSKYKSILIQKIKEDCKPLSTGCGKDLKDVSNFDVIQKKINFLLDTLKDTESKRLCLNSDKQKINEQTSSKSDILDNQKSHTVSINKTAKPSSQEKQHEEAEIHITTTVDEKITGCGKDLKDVSNFDVTQKKINVLLDTLKDTESRRLCLNSDKQKLNEQTSSKSDISDNQKSHTVSINKTAKQLSQEKQHEEAKIHITTTVDEKILHKPTTITNMSAADADATALEFVTAAASVLPPDKPADTQNRNSSATETHWRLLAEENDAVNRILPRPTETVSAIAGQPDPRVQLLDKPLFLPNTSSTAAAMRTRIQQETKEHQDRNSKLAILTSDKDNFKSDKENRLTKLRNKSSCTQMHASASAIRPRVIEEQGLDPSVQIITNTSSTAAGVSAQTQEENKEDVKVADVAQVTLCKRANPNMKTNSSAVDIKSNTQEDDTVTDVVKTERKCAQCRWLTPTETTAKSTYKKRLPTTSCFASETKPTNTEKIQKISSPTLETNEASNQPMVPITHKQGTAQTLIHHAPHTTLDPLEKRRQNYRQFVGDLKQLLTKATMIECKPKIVHTPETPIQTETASKPLTPTETTSYPDYSTQQQYSALTPSYTISSEQEKHSTNSYRQYDVPTVSMVKTVGFPSKKTWSYEMVHPLDLLWSQGPVVGNKLTPLSMRTYSLYNIQNAPILPQPNNLQYNNQFSSRDFSNMHTDQSCLTTAELLERKSNQNSMNDVVQIPPKYSTAVQTIPVYQEQTMPVYQEQTWPVYQEQTTPFFIDRVMTVFPEQIMPVSPEPNLPYQVMHGFPLQQTPNLSYFTVPGQATLGFPQHIVPTLPGQATRHFPQHMVPTVPGQAMLDFPQNIVPTVPGQATLGVSQHIMPTVAGQATLGFPQHIMPSVAGQATLGFPQHIVPTVPGQAIPTFPGQAMPVFPEQATPAFQGQAMPAFPGQAMPAFPSHAMPTFPGPAVPGFVQLAAPAFPEQIMYGS